MIRPFPSFRPPRVTTPILYDPAGICHNIANGFNNDRHVRERDATGRVAIRNGGGQVSKFGYNTVTETVERGSSGEPRGSQADGTSPSATTSDETRDETAVLSKDAIFDILKNRRRRLVLEFLRDRQASTLPDVAEHVAALENGKDVGRLTPSERKRVYVGLYQCHVPRLADAGVVDYDAERKTIELRDLSSLLYPYLDLDEGGSPNGDGSGRGGLWNWLPSAQSLLNRG